MTPTNPYMPPVPQPTIIAQVKTSLWGTGIRKTVTSLCVAVSAITGAIVGVAKAAPIVEPWWIAHRGYVRDREAPLLDRIIEVQLNQNADKRQRLLDEVPKRELELQSEQAQKLPQYRALVQSRVDRVKSELKTLDEQDKSLFNEKLSK